MSSLSLCSPPSSHHLPHRLWSYGSFLQDYREDDQGAEAMYARALQEDPLNIPADTYDHDKDGPYDPNA